MKLLVCGDIHCKPDILRKALEATKWDKFIFLGDACDNWGATQEQNIEMVKLLMDMKNKYEDAFVWLLGNHDWGYYDTSVRMSGHILMGESNVHYLMKEAKSMWDLFYFDGPTQTLFTHAGMGWDFLKETSGISVYDLRNMPGVNNPLNYIGPSCGGYSLSPSFIWARPDEVDALPTEVVKHQVVGHTPVEKIKKMNGLLVCDTFSQMPDGSFIGDKSLLLIDNQTGEAKAINLEGKDMYAVEL